MAANFREVEARRSAPLTKIAAEASRLDQERRTLAQQEQAVRMEQSKLPELDRQIDAAADAIKRQEEQLAGRAALEVTLRETQDRTYDAKVENGKLHEAMKALKERIDKLKSVEGALCPLCGQPMKAE